MKRIDITGLSFGNLIVKSYAYTKFNRAYWNCICNCGKEVVKCGKDLRNGKTKHINCGKEKAIKSISIQKNLVGQRFGRLVAIERCPHYNGNKTTFYKCICDCGKECYKRGVSLTNGTTCSCGCLSREVHSKNLLGQKFGKLLVTNALGLDKHKSRIWECKCDCGNMITATTVSLTHGKKHCGCVKYVPKTFVDLTGKIFGRLKVIQYAYREKDKNFWECECNCGNKIFTTSSCLTKGYTKSCGCLQRDLARRNKKHGYAHKLSLYYIWKSMKERCNNKNDKSYKNYGDRGIKVCNEWQNNYLTFHNWAFESGYVEEKLPNGKNKLTLDRINVNGDYEPSNCRWITNAEQARNKRNNTKVKYNGTMVNLRDLCDRLNVKYETMYRRIFCSHWDIEKALLQPIKRSFSCGTKTKKTNI